MHLILRTIVICWLCCIGLIGLLRFVVSLRPNVVFAMVSGQNDNGQLLLVDADTSIVVNISPPNSSNFTPAWSPDGRYLAFVSHDNGDTEHENSTEILVYAFDSSSTTNVTQSDAGETSPQWMSDSEQLVFIAWHHTTDEIYIVHREGGEWTNLSRNPGNEVKPIPAPISARQPQQVLYSTMFPNNVETFLAILNPQQNRNLSQHPRDDYAPTWSYDGEWISFESTRASGIQTYILNLETDEFRNVGLDNADDYQAAWSPTLHQIAFVSSANGQPDIYLYDVAENHYTRLTDASAHDKNPVWSPDGQRIAYTSGSTVMAVDVQSGVVQTMSPVGVDAYNPLWSPDGSLLLYLVRENGGMAVYISNRLSGKYRQVIPSGSVIDAVVWQP